MKVITNIRFHADKKLLTSNMAYIKNIKKLFNKKNISVTASSLSNKFNYESQSNLTSKNIINIKKNNINYYPSIVKHDFKIKTTVIDNQLTPELMAICCGNDCNFCPQKECNYESDH